MRPRESTLTPSRVPAMKACWLCAWKILTWVARAGTAVRASSRTAGTEILDVMDLPFEFMRVGADGAGYARRSIPPRTLGRGGRRRRRLARRRLRARLLAGLALARQRLAPAHLEVDPHQALQR